MAMGTVTAQVAQRVTPQNVTFTALGADGQKFKNTGKEIVIISRTANATTNVTIHTNKTKAGVVLPDLVFALAAGNVTRQFKFAGTFPTERYNQYGGWLEVTSAEATDTIAVLQVTTVD